MNKFFDRLFIWVGVGLLVVAAVAMFLWQRGIQTSQPKAEALVQTMRTLIPEPQSAVPEARRENTMAVLPVDGADFLGILELPAYNSALPVCATWGDTGQYPCRLSGSVYDRTLQIGATSQTGQYDFYRELSVGDAVFFTDVEGNRFSYEISHIRHESSADQTVLQREDAALTLFIQNLYGFEYIVIFCNTAG